MTKKRTGYLFEKDLEYVVYLIEDGMDIEGIADYLEERLGFDIIGFINERSPIDPKNYKSLSVWHEERDTNLIELIHHIDSDTLPAFMLEDIDRQNEFDDFDADSDN